MKTTTTEPKSLFDTLATNISPLERHKITEEILKRDILRGLDRTKRKGHAIGAIANALEAQGFELQLVTMDILLGDQGWRNLSFNRKGIDQNVENACIHFVWEELSGSKFTDHNNKRWEFLAYVS